MATLSPIAGSHSLFAAADSRPHALRALLPWMLLGFTGLLLTAASLMWRIWTADALRSIGIYFPILSVILTLRIWKKMNWEARGTWWGLLPLYYAVVMAREGGNALQFVAFTQHQGMTLLPLGLTVFAYGSGIVLLLGGARVWRKSLFPLALLLFVNPVPATFQRMDLPLQFLGARLAQSFASLIGVHPDVNQLHLMFSPGFGMFIAPGCDGIRGAVTMAYLALLLGYLYRFPVKARVLSVLGALALGYVFNLIRLCFLVLFYRLALSWIWLQPHGMGADYLIGGLLFLMAAALFAAVVRWKKQTSDTPASNRAPHDGFLARTNIPKRRTLYWRGAVTLILVGVSASSNMRNLVDVTRGETQQEDSSELTTQGVFPQQMGKYQMQRTWFEQDWLHRLAYRWATYSDSDSSKQFDVAVWLGSGVHYPIACHVAKGQRPAWQDVAVLPTAQNGSATFALYSYDDSEGSTLEANAVCDAEGCRQHMLLSPQSGLAFAGMGVQSFLLHPGSKPLPIVIRTHSHDLSQPTSAVRKQMLLDLRDFISQLNTSSLIRFAESRNH
jgi:exosortase J